MRKLRHIFVFVIILLTFMPLVACGKTDPRKDYKTAKPSYISSKNIFHFNRSEIKYAYFTAKKVLIYNDFSADIVYEIKDKTLEKETEDQPANSISKDNIIKALENYNKDQIYSSDSKLFEEDGNRVLYLDENSIKEEVIVNKDDTETTNIILTVYITNLSYVCNSYKLMSLEDFCKEEDDKTNVLAKDKAYNKFFENVAGKSMQRSINSKNQANPENFKVFVLENYSPSIDTEFIFAGKIIAYFNYADKVNETDPKSITINPDSSYIAVMYQINETQPLNWAILGPVIGVVTVFLILVSIKIIQTAKKKKSAKGK